MSAEELYHDAIKALAAAETGHGRLEPPAAQARLDNPLCGDRVEIDLRLEAGRVAALAHRVKGCLLCRAAASVIGRRAPGARPEALEAAAAGVAAMLEDGAPPPEGWDELGAFAPVRAHRSRHSCVLLPFRALVAALNAAGGAPG